MSNQISAVIITKNEAHNIERCILSMKSVADEVVIVDSGSTDKTIQLAENLNCKVVKSDWLGYALTKNLGNEAASNNIILSIDADEVLSSELISSIAKQKEIGFKGTFSFNRLTNYCGSWIRNSGWYPDEKIRIFNKTEVFWTGELVHETLEIPEEISNTKLNGDLHHYSYTSAEDHIQRADKYSELTALKMFNSEKKAGFLKPIFSPLVRFVKMYFIKLGFLDGGAGTKIALISAQSNRYKYQELNRLHKKEKSKKRINRICISRTDSLGDVMLTLPMCKALKEEFPGVNISFLGKNYTKALISNCQSVDEFISADDLLDSENLAGFIESKKFDAVFHVLPSKFWARVFKNANVPFRVGSGKRFYNLFLCNKKLFYTRKNSNLHESQLNLKMLEAINAKWKYSLEEISDLYDFKSDNDRGENLKKKIILHPKSQGSAPEWELKNFVKLASELEKAGHEIFISGTQKEGDLVRNKFRFSENVKDKTGEFTLEEFISFIGTCDLIIAASTGPIHIAAALGVNVIGLFTNQRPMHALRWAPVGKKATYIEVDSKNNILQLSVEDVMRRINEINL